MWPKKREQVILDWSYNPPKQVGPKLLVVTGLSRVVGLFTPFVVWYHFHYAPLRGLVVAIRRRILRTRGWVLWFLRICIWYFGLFDGSVAFHGSRICFVLASVRLTRHHFLFPSFVLQKGNIQKANFECSMKLCLVTILEPVNLPETFHYALI